MKPCNNRSECVYFKKNNTFYCRCLNGATSCDHDDVTTEKPVTNKKAFSSNTNVANKKKHEKLSDKHDKATYEIVESNIQGTSTGVVFTWQVNYTAGLTSTAPKEIVRISNAESKVSSEIPKFGFNYDNVTLEFI
jgi:hypothetical protein